jgi:hypothetical protein
MFALWPIGRYGDICGQIHNTLLKNRQILENMNNHLIFTNIFTLNKYFYDRWHKLSSLMSQTRFVYSFGHFGANITDF